MADISKIVLPGGGTYDLKDAGARAAIPAAYASNPAMDGTASPGSSGDYARGDHVHPSDTGKANQAQLATVETGSTASANYSKGAYFCRNGSLYRVTEDIASGASFTSSNCTAVTVGAELVNLKKYSSDDKGRVRGASVDVDISAYRASGAFAFLVVTRGWATATSASSIYLVHGIQTSSYVGVAQILKEQYGAAVTKKDAATVTLTWGTSDGGYYAILPIIKHS